MKPEKSKAPGKAGKNKAKPAGEDYVSSKSAVGGPSTDGSEGSGPSGGGGSGPIGGGPPPPGGTGHIGGGEAPTHGGSGHRGGAKTKSNENLKNIAHLMRQLSQEFDKLALGEQSDEGEDNGQASAAHSG